MPDDQKPDGRSTLLGLFVLFQAFYLPLSNLAQLAPREMPPEKGELDISAAKEGTATSIRPVQIAINELGTAIDRYGELSGQLQYWSLFAHIPTQSLFPMVEFDTTLGKDVFNRVILPPEEVPRDLKDYFRTPGPDCRLRSYEYLLAVRYAGCTKESLAADGPEWRKLIAERVRRQQKSLIAFFRYELALARRKIPHLSTPTVITLFVRVYPSPKPGATERPEPLTLKLAQWEPDQLIEPDYLPVKAYDPVLDRFVKLPVAEGER